MALRRKSKALKILYFTHNSLGIGHAVRTLAIIRGLRKINQNIKFLVVTASKVPNIFLDEGIEVVKLPSTILTKGKNRWALKPRFLDIGISNIIGMRYKILLDCFYSLRPHAVFIDNILSGQGSELLPIILHRHIEKETGNNSFLLYLISRGILDAPAKIIAENNRNMHLSTDINSLEVVDRIFILENKYTIDFNKDYDFGVKENRFQYLGKIITKVKQDLLEREDILIKNGIPLDKKVVLVRLGHEDKDVGLLKKVINSFKKFNKLNDDNYFLMVCSEPYADKSKVMRLIDGYYNKNISHRIFISDMIDLIYHSEIVISRAGYNITAEIEATGTRAILIPFEQRTGEQLMRAKSIKNKRIKFLLEKDVTEKKIIDNMNFLVQKNLPKKFSSNRDKICDVIHANLITDLKKYHIKQQ